MANRWFYVPGSQPKQVRKDLRFLFARRSRFRRPVQSGDRVQVHYVKRLQNGSVRSSRTPLELTVGIRHPRLPGLGTALVGMTPGQVTTLSVPAEQAYGLANPTRVRRWPRRRFPEHEALEPGQLVRLADVQGRGRLIRILEVKGKVVVVDANHPWAGQALELEVRLVAICEADAGTNVPVPEREGPASPASSPRADGGLPPVIA
jgi:peptidylprolyl isomerase